MIRNSNINFLVVVIVTILLFPAITTAQTDPKGTYPGPPGSDAFLFYYRHIEGHEGFVNGEKLTKNASLDVDLSILRFVHYGQVASSKWTWTVNALVPFGSMHLEQGAFNQTSSGFADPTLLFGVYTPLGPQGLMAYLVEYVTAPLGDYHNDQVVNMGNNCWSFKTEAQVAWKPVDRLTWEVGGSVEFFTENDDYKMGNELKRDPRYILLSHLSWDFTKTFFMAGSFLWTYGAETEVNGVMSNNEVDTKNVMFTGGLKYSDNTQLLLQIAHDFDVKNGTGTDAIRFRFAYFW